MITAIYNQENNLLIIPGDFTGRLPELTSHPIISYEMRGKLSLENEIISCIPYSIMPNSKNSKGQEVPAKMVYRAGSLEAASIMVNKIKGIFNLSIVLENENKKDEKKYQSLLEKINQ